MQQLVKEWEPFTQLWTTTYHFLKDVDTWMTGPFDQIDAKYCENSVTNGSKTLFKVGATRAKA